MQGKKFSAHILGKLFLSTLSSLTLLLTIPIFTVTKVHATGTEYHVDSVYGNDTNSGTSSGSSWQTLSKLNTATLTAGDIVYLHRGSSWNGELRITNTENGTSTNPIIVTAYGSGTIPTITNTTVTDGGGRYRGVALFGDYAVIDGIRITGVNYSGVEIYENAVNNTIQNLEIDNSGVGIRIKDSNTTVVNNYIHDMVMVTNDPSPNNNDYGALGISIEGVNNAVNNTLIERNTFINCKASSYDYGQDGGAVEIFGQLDNTTIRYNYAEDGKGFVEVGGPNVNPNKLVSDTLIHHNVMKNNYAIFVQFNGGANIYKADIDNFTVENNTWYEATTVGSPIYFQGDTAIAAEFFMKNNFLYAGSRFTDITPATHQYNGYSRWNGTQVGYSLGTGEFQNNTIANMAFVDVSNDNFRIGSSSLLKDTGTSLGYSVDMDRTSIPQNSIADIGAYEYISSLSTAAPVTITPTGGSTSVTENGATDTVSVVLNFVPTSDVTLDFDTNHYFTTSAVTFTTTNWNVAQTVTLTARNNDLDDGNHSTSLTGVTVSDDSWYSNKTLASQSVTVNDEDTSQLVIITETGGNTTLDDGGGTDTFTIKLSSQPTDEVMINFFAGYITYFSTDPLYFDSTNWNTPVTITVSTDTNQYDPSGMQLSMDMYSNDSTFNPPNNAVVGQFIKIVDVP